MKVPAGPAVVVAGGFQRFQASGSQTPAKGTESHGQRAATAMAGAIFVAWFAKQFNCRQ